MSNKLAGGACGAGWGGGGGGVGGGEVGTWRLFHYENTPIQIYFR